MQGSYVASRAVQWLAMAAATTAVMVGLAACGSSTPSAVQSGSKAATTSTTPPSTAAATTSATVDTAQSTDYGTILVNASGRTLYMLTGDSSTASICTAACVAVWPPLTVTAAPTAGTGVTASLLSTIKRADGTRQVTYNGHPLYTFAKDTAPGQVNGEGINHFGGIWYVLNAAGQPVTAKTAGSGTTTSTSSYGGY